MRPSLALILVALMVPFVNGQSRSRSSGKRLAEDYSFKIKAGPVWTDTGIDLHRGDRVHIHGADLDCGGPYPGEKSHLPLPSAPGGALLFKLQPEADPVAAVPDADFPIVAPSHLYLGVNAWQCRRTLPANVHVDWHTSGPK